MKAAPGAPAPMPPLASHATGDDEALARAFEALANPMRLALLRDLRAPRTLGSIRVAPADGESPALARQSVRRHLDRLLDAGLLAVREPEGRNPEYLASHQALYALSEELRALASLPPEVEPEVETAPAPGVAPPAPAGPCLVLVHGARLGHVYPLPSAPGRRAEWVVGRRRGSPVALDFDPYASAENAVVEWDGASHHLRDLPGSTNGTQLNLRPLAAGARAPLRHGDLLGVGRSLLLFRAG